MGKLARHTSAKRESKKEINVARHPTMPNAQCRKPFFSKILQLENPRHF